MSANYSIYFNIAIQALQRNNPVVQLINQVTATVYHWMTYKSNLKLNKYRQNLYSQQLKRMEGYLREGSVYQYRGSKMDRAF